MTSLRTIFKWINQHRMISALITAGLIAGLYVVIALQNRSAGQYTEVFQRGTIVESVYGIGTVTAKKIWRIKPGVVNTITQLWVQEGDTVRKGQRLIRNEVMIWRAPFAGTITALPFKSGENVFADVALLTLVDLSDRYLVVSMEQQGAMRVKVGQKVKMSFDSFRDKNYDGTVQAIYSNETNYLARIEISALPLNILPGMTADAAIEIIKNDDALVIPVAAIENGVHVWRKRGNELPKKIEIKTGIIDRDMAEVLSGDLQVGDRALLRKDLAK